MGNDDEWYIKKYGMTEQKLKTSNGKYWDIYFGLIHFDLKEMGFFR